MKCRIIQLLIMTIMLIQIPSSALANQILKTKHGREILINNDGTWTYFKNGGDVFLDARKLLMFYLDRIIEGNFGEAYDCVSDEDKKHKSLMNYIGENTTLKDNDEGKIVSYQILEFMQDDNQTMAFILMEKTSPPPSIPIFPGMDDLYKYILTLQKINPEMLPIDLPTEQEIAQVALIKEGNKWKIYENWKYEIEWNEKQTDINIMYSKAERKKEVEDFEGARKIYIDILNKNKFDYLAKYELEQIENKIAEKKLEKQEAEKKQKYFEKIELKNFKVSGGERYGEKVQGVFGTIVNNGNQTLQEVEITVYFLDSNGNAIGEKTYHPVLYIKRTYNDEPPLKPNYVDDFGYSVEDDAPSNWSGEAKCKITNFEFME